MNDTYGLAPQPEPPASRAESPASRAESPAPRPDGTAPRPDATISRGGAPRDFAETTVPASAPSAPTHPNASVRSELARQLHGAGVEFGPGSYPLPLGPYVESIRYCDAMDRASFLENFPEGAHDIAGFPARIDFRLNFERDPFVDRIGAGSLDFVIANHVLEHLINPLRFLEQGHQLLNEGGLLYVGLPDKRRVFDVDRQRTPLSDVVARFDSNQTEVEERRLVDFVRQVERPGQPFGPDSPDYEEEIARHRRRSIHVNVWLIDDLISLFLHLGRALSAPFELIDGLVCEEEFILLFRKTDRIEDLDRYPITLARLWTESQQRHLETQYRPRLVELEHLAVTLHDRILVADERLREVQQFIQGIKRIGRMFPGAPAIERWWKRRG